jgi:hypothetical protein
VTEEVGGRKIRSQHQQALPDKFLRLKPDEFLMLKPDEFLI